MRQSPDKCASCETAGFERGRLSVDVTVTELPDAIAVAGQSGTRRLTLDPRLGPLLQEMRRRPVHSSEIAERSDGEVEGTVLLRLLCSRRLLECADGRAPLPTRETEDLPIAGEGGPVGYRQRQYWDPRPLTSTGAYGDRSPRLVRLLAVGGCVAEFASDALVAHGVPAGFDIICDHRWPGPVGSLRREVEQVDPDVVVLHLGVQMMIGRLWDEAHLLSAETIRRRMEALKRALSARVRELADCLPHGACGLVHNIAPPAYSPFGRLDFRRPYGFRRIVAEVNAHIDEEVRGHPDMYVVDEERLAVRHGSVALFDDTVFPFAHHGGSVDPTVDRPHQLPALSDALAREYVALLQIHRGAEPVKCVVVDLDDTLWPGILADEGPGWLDRDTTSRWTHLGLHQALRVLKERGVLLATCSKGDEEATMAAWRSMSHPMLLSPEDFVVHHINWGAKSESIRRLCDQLGTAPEHLLVCDDNPVERAEIRHHLPGVRVLDAPVHEFRSLLLGAASLEPAVQTEEARGRGETTRALIRRDELARESGEDFLQSLDISIEVWDAEDTDLPRVSELLSRTTQYVTADWRPSVGELRDLRAGGARLFVGRVRDTFADYGLVAACAIRDAEVLSVAVSCRVIGLDTGPVFVAACLRESGLARLGTTARLEHTRRNTPARGLFSRLGFAARDDARWVLSDLSMFEALDTAPHRVSVRPGNHSTEETTYV